MAHSRLIAAHYATAGVARGIIPIVELIDVDADDGAAPSEGNSQGTVLSRSGYRHAGLMPNLVDAPSEAAIDYISRNVAPIARLFRVLFGLIPTHG